MRSLGLMLRLRRVRMLAALTALLPALLAGSAGAAPNPDTQPSMLGGGAWATGFTAGPDGNLWFAGSSLAFGTNNMVGLVRPDRTVTQYPLPARPVVRGGDIATGPDGRVWFTDPGSNQVGRVEANHQLTLFPLASPGAEPGAIVAGPDGAMWFVEEAADRVGRVDPSGTVTEFLLPQGARPTGIAKGPDGALWIAENGGGRISRMAPNGVVTQGFPLPDPEGRPHAIVAGPDGHLWFTQEGAPRIGRIAVGGSIDEYRVPGTLGTRELALGGDGNLWFSAGPSIGSISPTGATGEPECIDTSCRWPITALVKGPDSELWFATGIGETNGGGGTALAALQAGGLVGKFRAPLLSVRLGKQLTRVKDGLTTVAVSCHGGSAGQSCRGWLRITAQVQRADRRGGRAKVLLDQHRYRLEPATSRRLPLFLGARGRRALERAGGKRLAVQVTATRADAGGSSKRYVLKAGRRR